MRKRCRRRRRWWKSRRKEERRKAGRKLIENCDVKVASVKETEK